MIFLSLWSTCRQKVQISCMFPVLLWRFLVGANRNIWDKNQVSMSCLLCSKVVSNPAPCDVDLKMPVSTRGMKQMPCTESSRNLVYSVL